MACIAGELQPEVHFFEGDNKKKRQIQKTNADRRFRSPLDIKKNILLQLSALYLDAFFETLAREWSGLDRLRLDKFMLLVRSFVGVTFSLAAGTRTAASSSSASAASSSSAAVAASSAPWCPKRAERLLRPLSEAMCPSPGAPLLSSGSGLGLHLADVAAGELLRAIAASSSSSSSSSSAPPTSASSSSPAAQEGILAAVLPFSRAAATTQRPELATRLSREFFSKVADAIREGGGSEGEESGVGGKKTKRSPSLLSPSLAALLSKQLLSLESLPETRARNREVLYAAAAELEAAGEEAKREKREKREKKEKKKAGSAVVADEASPDKESAEQPQPQRGEKQPKSKKRPAAPEAAAPPTPPSGGPSKAAEQAAASAAAGTAGRGATAAAAAAAAPEAKKAKTAAPAPAAAGPTPPAPTAEQAAEELARREKKRVRWSFKSNLAHAVGGPVPPPHVRTPPGSAPRGAALRVKGAGAATRRAVAAAAAAAAAAEAARAEAEAGGSRKGSARARADAFF